MKITPLDRQSVIDIAIQTSGSVEAAFTLSATNNISISGVIAPGSELEMVTVADKLVLSRYEARGIRPATDISPRDLELVPYGGINYMGVEIDFIVS